MSGADLPNWDERLKAAVSYLQEGKTQPEARAALLEQFGPKCKPDLFRLVGDAARVLAEVAKLQEPASMRHLAMRFLEVGNAALNQGNLRDGLKALAEYRATMHEYGGGKEYTISDVVAGLQRMLLEHAEELAPDDIVLLRDGIRLAEMRMMRAARQNGRSERRALIHRMALDIAGAGE